MEEPSICHMAATLNLVGCPPLDQQLLSMLSGSYLKSGPATEMRSTQTLLCQKLGQALEAGAPACTVRETPPAPGAFLFCLAIWFSILHD